MRGLTERLLISGISGVMSVNSKSLNSLPTTWRTWLAFISFLFINFTPSSPPCYLPAHKLQRAPSSVLHRTERDFAALLGDILRRALTSRWSQQIIYPSQLGCSKPQNNARTCNQLRVDDSLRRNLSLRNSLNLDKVTVCVYCYVCTMLLPGRAPLSFVISKPIPMSCPSKATSISTLGRLECCTYSFAHLINLLSRCTENCMLMLRA